MNNKITVMIALIENRGVSIRKISEILGMDYKNTYNIVMELQKTGTVFLERFGNALRCSAIKTPHPLIFEAEHQRREAILKNADMKILYEKLNALKFSFIAVLFGSHAKGGAKPGSDMDILVISEKNRSKYIEEKLSLLPLPVDATYLTSEDFMKMAMSKEFTVVSEAMKMNIILIGIEDYYRLVENVGQA